MLNQSCNCPLLLLVLSKISKQLQNLRYAATVFGYHTAIAQDSIGLFYSTQYSIGLFYSTQYSIGLFYSTQYYMVCPNLRSATEHCADSGRTMALYDLYRSASNSMGKIRVC